MLDFQQGKKIRVPLHEEILHKTIWKRQCQASNTGMVPAEGSLMIKKVSGSLSKVLMWDFVQVAVVATLIHGSRFYSLGASTIAFGKQLLHKRKMSLIAKKMRLPVPEVP
ncbi:unnamed protein product [Prunus armeniaca]